MILAAPLVIPFAEAIGLSVAVLGMAKIGDEVNKYIEKYPEESMKILSTIVPGIGIGEIFMNKEDSGDDEEVEVEEDTRSKKEIVLGELGKDKGNYSDEDAEGKYASKRGRIIRALEDAGKVNPDKEYKPEKKYKGYERFLKKADGGSIGIEVLFEPKRKDFNIGGNVQRVTTPQPYDARASAADFARAIDKVGAGTDLQKAVAIGEYGQNVQRQNPFKNLGFFDTQRHFDNNQLLKNAVTRGELSPADYNRLGGFDVAQTMGAGNPVLGGIGNLIGSTAYNAYQSIKDGQPILEGIKDIARNVQGGTGLISDDLKAQYESIINPTVDQDRISEIVEQQKAAGVPDEGLITNFNRPTMADVAGPIQDSKRENLYLKDIGIDGINDESPLNILQKYLDLNKNIKDNTVLQDYAEGARSGYLSDYIDPYAEGFNLEKDYFNNPNNLRRLAIDYDPRSGKLAYYDKNEGPYGAYKYYSGDLVDQDFVSSYGLKRFDPKDLSNFATPQAYGPALADGGRVGFKGGGHQDFPPFKGPKGKKRGFENVMDGPDAGAAARAYLAQQQKQSQPTKAIAPSPKPNLDNMNYIRQSMNAYGFSEPEILKAITQAGYENGGRVGLFMGGDPLTGQALAIYNSMNAYGFSDQEIANALEGQGYYTPGSSTPETTAPNIIGSQLNQRTDSLPTTPTSATVSSFSETIEDRQNKLKNPGKIASFVDKFVPQQRSIADMLASNQVDKRLTGGIPLGVGSLITKALPDKYYDMSLADQITTQAYMGFTDPNTNMANKDPFGLNVRSMFGNYAEKAAEIVDTLEAKLSKNGKLSKYDQTRLDHYRSVTKTKQDALADIGLINLAKEQERKRQEKIAADIAAGKSLSQVGRENYTGPGMAFEAGNTDAGGGFTGGKTVDSPSTPGGKYGSPRKDGGLMYAEGGLVTMFKEKR